MKDIIAAFRNEASLYNSEASVKAKSPDNEPVELKPFGEFCKPTRFGNFCAPD